MFRGCVTQWAFTLWISCGYDACKNETAMPAVLVVQPTHSLKQTTKLLIVRGKRREPFANRFTFPPCFIANWRKPITKESRSNVMGWCVGKGIACKQRQRARVIV